MLDAEFVQQRMVHWLSELTINYRRSPIVAQDERRLRRPVRGPRSGDRFPDAPLLNRDGQQQRVFDLLRHPQHTLLLFDGATSPLERQPWTEAATAMAQNYGDLIRVARVAVTPDRSDDAAAYDPDLIAHRRYGVEQGGLYLIRPDGYVAFRATPPDPEALLHYLRSVFVAADPTAGRMMAGSGRAES